MAGSQWGANQKFLRIDAHLGRLLLVNWRSRPRHLPTLLASIEP